MDTITPSAPRRDPHVAGEPASERLVRRLDYRLSPPGTAQLTNAQVAIVLHALADHTALVTALAYRKDETSSRPEAQSVGRWLHDVADQLERAGSTLPTAGQEAGSIPDTAPEIAAVRVARGDAS